MPCVYVILSQSKNSFYTGSSRKDDIDSRLSAHNAGRVRSTKSGIPWQKVYEEKHLNYTDARKRELFLKSGMGRKWVGEQFGHYKK